jgi:hypothetical protein
VLRCRREREPKPPVAGLTQPVHPHNIRQDPTRRRLLRGVPRGSGTRRLVGVAGWAAAGCAGRHPPAHGHPQAPGQEACRRLPRQRGGQPRRVVHKAAAAFPLPLAWVARQDGWRRALGGGVARTVLAPPHGACKACATVARAGRASAAHAQVVPPTGCPALTAWALGCRSRRATGRGACGLRRGLPAWGSTLSATLT